MSKKLKEVRLNLKTGKVSVKNSIQVSQIGTAMYREDYVYLTVEDKVSSIKKAAKTLINGEIKKIDKTIKDKKTQLDKMKKNLLKNKI